MAPSSGPRMAEVLVIGAGLGGLAAAIRLAAGGERVTVLEAATEPGGKAGRAILDGVEVDTGPSVLTLPEILDELFEVAGTRTAAELELLRPDPAFRYMWPDGSSVDLYQRPEDSAESVARSLGAAAGAEFQAMLRQAARIWDLAAPAFVLGPPPGLDLLRRVGPLGMLRFAEVDPWRSMWDAITRDLRTPQLRDIFARYATYNGSDVRRAPATLNCIAHVELTLGGFGVRGGIWSIVTALVRAAERLGVRFRYEAPVERLLVQGGRAAGVLLRGGEALRADAVVCNADVAHLVTDLTTENLGMEAPKHPSMSGWTAIVRARRQPRLAHTVLFADPYLDEPADIFDRDAPPERPTVYVCAQEVCHGRTGWAEHEPLFVMANAPAEPAEGPRDPQTWHDLRERVRTRLRDSGLVEDEEVLWERTPGDLARRFPGSRGALYGAASNSMFAAFARPANRVSKLPGLALASGSAHPGGGMPLCLQSGKLASRVILDYLGDR